jgi:hypothetical protein
MFKYNVYYDGTWLHEDTGWETYEEARDDAELYIESKIADWEVDGVEYDRELFSIEVEED